MNDTANKIINSAGYTSNSLKRMWEDAKQAGVKKDTVFKLIDSVDKGEPWSITRKQIKRSQALPVTNVLSTNRDTRYGALSVRGFVGEFRAEAPEAAQSATMLQKYFTYLWEKGSYDEPIGDALMDILTFGTGAVLISHASNAPISKEQKYEFADNVVIKSIDPTTIYPEPGAKSITQANYFFIKDVATLEYLETIPQFQEGIENNRSAISGVLKTTDSGNERLTSDSASVNTNYRESDFITYIGRVLLADGSYRWDMVYMFAGQIICIIEGIQPNMCPLIVGREQLDKASFWGQSTFKKNLPLALNINDLDSALISHAKKQQDPATFVKASSGINIADFAKNKDVPGRVFTFNGQSVSDAVGYLTLPNLNSDAAQTSQVLFARISQNSGDSGAYSGADMGSVQTAGGISQVISRASLKDVRPVELFERFLRDVYQVLLEYAKTQPNVSSFTFKDPEEGEISYGNFDPTQVNWDKISLIVDIFNHTQSNKQENVAMIQALWQQSVQYSAAQPISEPAIMTVEEYLAGIKDRNLTNLIDRIEGRRKREKEIELVGIVTQIIQLFTTLVGDGLSPQEAIIAVSQEYSTDPGILKAFKVADLAKEQMAAQAGGMQGQNGITAT